MNAVYITGISSAILSGVLNQVGQLLQKKAVNNLPEEVKQTKFMRTLLKNPLWLTGLILSVVFGSAFFMIAQNYIGPALVPGFMASGLIVLAIGSVWMNGESFDASEIAGILVMIAGIAFMGLSELTISCSTVISSLTYSSTINRITVFSFTLTALWILIHFISLRSGQRKYMVMAISNGFLFAISNFWVSPLLAVFFLVLNGKGSSSQVVIFVLASVILIAANFLGTWQSQESYRYGQASNIVPLRQVSMQIPPLFVYFYVFALKAPSVASVAYMLSGAAFIMISGLLLGKRREETVEQTVSVLET
jgi:hypothetical protein